MKDPTCEKIGSEELINQLQGVVDNLNSIGCKSFILSNEDKIHLLEKMKPIGIKYEEVSNFYEG